MASSAADFCYSDVPSAASAAAAHLGTQFHGGYDPTQSEIFSPANMDMIGFPKNNHQLMFVDDSTCVFERPSQGLSLSLSSVNPSTIGLQSFELRHQIRSSRFLGPVQELLNEFCSLGFKQNQEIADRTWTRKTNDKSCVEDDCNNNNGSSSSSSKPLSSVEFLELQKRKTKLVSLLEEVDRRYRHYRDQMKAVVASFEAVAGTGAASVYSALASKAMSRHFRCLRDGIVSQIQATKKAVGENDPVAPGTTRGETPRLKVIDQTLRQHKAFQQMNTMESHPWRPQRGLPERSVSILRAWLFEHFLHPYPSDVDKHILARQTGLSRGQVSNWFINARVRLWKPMVEEMYMEETKDPELSDRLTNLTADSDSHQTQNSRADQDQKPSTDQLVRIDSECLSSIITTPDKNPNHSKATLQNSATQHQHGNPSFLGHHHGFGQVRDSFSAMDLDFSSYHHHSGGSFPYNENPTRNFNGGVSLTLGLQHHNSGSGLSIAGYPTTSQSSLFYPRGDHHIEDCQTVQYLMGSRPGWII